MNNMKMEYANYKDIKSTERKEIFC